MLCDLRYSQVLKSRHPIGANFENISIFFSKFEKIIVCELNTGQFASYLRTMVPGREYLQCNKVQGQTFLVRDIVESVNEKA